MLRDDDISAPEIVLIDFGLTRAMAADEPGLITGTLGYIPPETWERGHWFPGGDVFSIGVCMLQVLIDKTSESDGVTKKLFPKIMLRSPSPSEAAPKSGAFSENITFTSSFAYVKFGSG